MNTSSTLRWFPFWRAMGYGWVAAVIVASLIPMENLPDLGLDWMDKALHCGTYGFLMLWFAQLYPPERFWRIAVAFTLMGMVLEALQAGTDYRFFEILDMVSNTLGVALGWGMAHLGARDLFYRLERFAFNSSD